MGRATVLCFDESGNEGLFHVSSAKDELRVLVAHSIASRDPVLQALSKTLSEHVWLSTFTAGPIVDERTGAEVHVAVSVLGNPTGNNRSAAVKRLQETLPENRVNRSFQGPIVFKVETPERRCINPASVLKEITLPEFVEAARKIVEEFECGMQWVYCPRMMKRPA